MSSLSCSSSFQLQVALSKYKLSWKDYICGLKFENRKRLSRSEGTRINEPFLAS